jgi:hypothetical protein
MAVFTVHQPPLGKGENIPDPTRFHFVRDGFYVWGFLFSVLWMLRHKLWLAAALFAALAVLIEIGLRWAGVGVGIRSLVLFALCFLVGLEGATLRRWTLSLRGYIPAGVVIADNRDEAERRFFLNWTASRPAPPAKPAVSGSAPSLAARTPRHPANDVIGSFPQPEPPR